MTWLKLFSNSADVFSFFISSPFSDRMVSLVNYPSTRLRASLMSHKNVRRILYVISWDRRIHEINHNNMILRYIVLSGNKQWKPSCFRISSSVGKYLVFQYQID